MNRRERNPFSTAVLLLIGTASMPGMLLASAERIGVPDSGVELGLGWDTQSARVIPNRCIEFAPLRETGQTSRLKLSEVSDKSDLMESLNVSASMAVRSMVASGSAQAEFATQSRVSRNSETLVIRATVDNGVTFVGPAHPGNALREALPTDAADEPKARLDRGHRNLPVGVVLNEFGRDVLGDGSAAELRRFEKQCGDSFISAIYSGAELIATMSFESVSSSSKSSTRARAKAEFSAWGVSGEAETSVDSGNESSDEQSNVELEYVQIGGAGGIIPTNREDFMSKLHDLPLEAMRGPNFHAMDVMPYSDLPGWPSLQNLDVDQDPVESLLVDYYWTIGSLLDQLETIESDSHTERLVRLQDQMIEHRRNIFRLLLRSHAADSLRLEEPYFFGFLARPNPAAEQTLNQLREDLEQELDE